MIKSLFKSGLTAAAGWLGGKIAGPTGSAIANLNTTMAAGTTIFLNVTAITLTSGVALCYYEQPL
jgi:hypothetical protein